MKKGIFLLLSLAFFGACTENSTTLTDIPSVEMECGTTVCQAASGAKDAIAIISLSGCAPDQVDLESVASGSVTGTCNGTTCTATVNDWKDRNGNAITQIISRSYYICSRFNLDGVVGPSAGDEFSEVRKTIVSNDPIDANNGTWGLSYFSRSVRP